MPRGVPGSAIKTKNGDKRHNLTRYLMNVMASATEADLKLIDAKIAVMDAELRGLRALREAFAERVLNIPKEMRGPVEIATSGDIDEDLRTKIVQYLKYHGPTTMASLRRHFDLEYDEARQLLAEERFEEANKLFRLTAKGEAFMEKLTLTFN